MALQALLKKLELLPLKSKIQGRHPRANQIGRNTFTMYFHVSFVYYLLLISYFQLLKVYAQNSFSINFSFTPLSEQIYKALNTVLAFCSSRQHIATTFQTIRVSVEKILNK